MRKERGGEGGQGTTGQLAFEMVPVLCSRDVSLARATPWNQHQQYRQVRHCSSRKELARAVAVVSSYAPPTSRPGREVVNSVRSHPPLTAALYSQALWGYSWTGQARHLAQATYRTSRSTPFISPHPSSSRGDPEGCDGTHVGEVHRGGSGSSDRGAGQVQEWA